MVVDSNQRVCKNCLEKMEKIGLFWGRKSSFDKALETLITFCEDNTKEFEKWMKKKKNQQ